MASGRRPAVIVFVLVTAFLPVFNPVIEELVNILPDWAIPILVAFVLVVLRGLTFLFFGEKASDQAWAALFVDAVAFVLLLPFKIRTERLAIPQRVYRYVTGEQSALEAKGGLRERSHAAPTDGPGRALTADEGKQFYGLPHMPKRRDTWELPAGMLVRRDKVMYGAPRAPGR